MSTTKSRRAKQVEAKLSPKEVVLAHLREAQQFECIHDHTKKMLDDPRPSICDRIAEATEAEMKGEPTYAINRMVRKRCHEALFLCHLTLAAESAIQIGRRADCLQLLALIHELHLLRMTIETGYGFDEDRWAKKVRTWRQTIIGFLGAKMGVRDAIKALEDDYLSGESMLFRETRDLLETIIRETDRVLSLYEDLVGEAEYRCGEEFARTLPAPPTEQDLQAIARAASVAEARTLLDTAKVDAFKAMGMDEAAMDVYRRCFDAVAPT